MTAYPRTPTTYAYPDTLQITAPGELDLCTKNAAVVFDIRDVDVLTWQVDAPETGWATSAVISFEVSNNGRQWYNHPGGAVTISAAELSDRKDVGGYRFARFSVSTAGSGTSPLKATICVHGRSRPIVGTI